MAFIALVYIDDHTADAVRAGDPPWDGSGRTVGLFRWPSRTEFGCTGCISNGKTTWGRSPEGFTVCLTCGLRHKLTRRWFIGSLFDRLGANEIKNAPPAFRTPDGYGVSYADND
jgi:hypothetical protein